MILAFPARTNAARAHPNRAPKIDLMRRVSRAVAISSSELATNPDADQDEKLERDRRVIAIMIEQAKVVLAQEAYEPA